MTVMDTLRQTEKHEEEKKKWERQTNLTVKLPGRQRLEPICPSWIQPLRSS